MSKKRKEKATVHKIRRGVGFSKGLNKGISEVQRTVAKMTRENKNMVSLEVTLIGPLIENPEKVVGETAAFAMRPQDAYDFFKSAGECFGAVFEETDGKGKDQKIEIVGANHLPISREG